MFFTCSLNEYIARKTKNHRSVVVNALGKDMIAKIYDLADIYKSNVVASCIKIMSEKISKLTLYLREEYYFDIFKLLKRFVFLVLGGLYEKGQEIIW